MKKTSLFENALIWFGAGVSIAEILTGTYLAPLGLKNGILAIVTGHVIGCILMFLAGVIGGKMRLSAMDSTKMSFGQKGCLLFAALNVLQLVGWTAIMIYDGALAADGIMHTDAWIWCLIIGILILVWIGVGITNLGKINTVAMVALFVLTLMLSKFIFFDGNSAVVCTEAMTFGAGVELAIAMPLSWLPLISDYTREAEDPVKAGLGIAGLLIIVFSTVTTTFLDAYSAGISNESIVPKWNGKHVAMVVTVVGTIAAIVYPMDNITDFLYLIGSVFAPMIAIQIADFFFLKNDKRNVEFDVLNLVLWLVGFVVYRCFMQIDTPVGNTIPCMIITILLSVVIHKIMKKNN